ncbi:unnamed protein product [Rotaria sp. Silwood1]|nr:unnamed protein product [Rotaria sp. Silwood1]
MDVLLDISSIFNFLVIVIDRYCIINYPFKYASLGKIKLLAFMISGIWIVSALISIPSILGWGHHYISTPFNCYLSVFVSCRSSITRHVQSRNQQAIRTLGVILGLFLIGWLPLILFAIIKPLHENITGSSRSLNAPSWVYSV